MKKTIVSIISLLISISIWAQTPQSFNYQAIVRDALGVVIENQDVSIKIDIIKGNSSGPSVYSESFVVTTNQFGLVNIEVGTGTILSGNFQSVDWGGDSYFLKIELDPAGGTTYQIMGISQLLSVPYALYSQNSADSSLWEKNLNDIYYNQGNVGIGAITPNGKLLVQSDASAGVNDDIFSVLNANGDTVFAVYQEGVRIYVDDNGGTKANGSRGGFAVGGFSPTKAGFTNEYLRVTPDSVRVYINDDFVSTKANGSRGGFAVGGFNPAKGSITDNYLFVQDDSSRVWTNGDGGFGILDLATGSTNYLDLTPNNYFIGHESGDSITTGLYNSFIGYQAGKSNDVANDNVFIGYRTGLLNKNGSQNVFLGKEAGYSNVNGYSNCFIGHQAGYHNIDGYRNVFMGQEAGFNNLSGFYNVFMGYRAGMANTSGAHNDFIGYQSGVNNLTGWTNVFLGSFTGYDNTTGSENVFIGGSSGVNNATGTRNVYMGYSSGLNCNNSDNVFLGYKAGYNEVQGNRLYIENTDASSASALIYGEFDNNKLRVNYYLGVGRMAATNTLEIQGDASKTTAGLWAANSDKRIKTDIQEIDNPYEIVLKLHPVKFKYTEEWKKRNPSIEDRYYYNFIAQEYQQVFPSSVKGSGEYLEGDNIEILQVDAYNSQIVTLKAVQELIKDNKSLKEDILRIKKEKEELSSTNSEILLRLEKVESLLNSSAKK